MSVFYRGVSQAQDPRLRDRERQALDARSWPAFMSAPWVVPTAHVEQLRLWVDARLAKLLNREDEFTANLVLCWLTSECPGDVRQLWLSLEPLLGPDTPLFFEELRAAVDGLGAAGELQCLQEAREAREEAQRRRESELRSAYLKVLQEYGSSSSSSSSREGSPRRRRRIARRLST